MFRQTNFDKSLEKATSHLLMEPDWPSIMQICDLIRQNDVQPRNALNAIKKKLQLPNPASALYALLVLESIVKNCGPIVHEELTTKQFTEFLHELVKSTPHDNVRQKLLELIQTWSFALRKNPKHGALKDLMALMKAEGFKFPVLRESDAMFAADMAPEWADGDVCHRCRTTFSLMNRKHHCRACGQVFCGQCTSNTVTLPKYGIEKEVRVCDTCFEQATKPTRSAKSSKQDTELPPEYLKSSLAHQNQEPPKKSEDELREEEELQLALALSQSEAEAKEKEKLKITSTLHTTYAKDTRNQSPPPTEEQTNPELAKYLNRPFWESLQSNDSNVDNHVTSPSAPSPAPSLQGSESKLRIKKSLAVDDDLEEFIKTLKSQVEIFINRMKSNSSRGRSISNDTSVQTLFMNITAMHSRLLKYIQEHDDSRLHYERLQDKITQVKDARAALDALRDEHREKLRREAEEAERQRQLQMAHKLDIMRKKKQEYLQYQRQVALQRIQEQEREMHMRQEQQKQQYLMSGNQFGGFVGSPVHGQQFIPNSSGSPGGPYYGQFGQVMAGQPSQNVPTMGHGMPPNPQASLTLQGMHPTDPNEQQPPAGPTGQSQTYPPPRRLMTAANSNALMFGPQQPMIGVPPAQGMITNAPPLGQAGNPATAATVPRQPQHFQQEAAQPPTAASQPQQQPEETKEAATAELISFD